MDIPEQFNAATYFIDRHMDTSYIDKIAIDCDGTQITYKELHDQVNKFGNYLLNKGVRKGDRIVLLLLDTPWFAISFFAAIKIGAIPIPLNTQLGSDQYDHYFNDSDSSTLIVDKALANAVTRDLKNFIVIDTDLESELQNRSSDLQAAATHKDDEAFWLYTSGSTGLPKACVHLQHDMVVTSEHFAKGVLNIDENDRCFSVSKLYFAYGLGNALYFPLSVGATAILLPDRPKPERIFEIIEKYKPSLFFSVPTNYLALLEHDGDYDLSSIRHCVSAGEPLPRVIFDRFKDRFGHEILDGIGSTEALQTFISNRPDNIMPGSTGEIVPGYNAKITNAEGNLVTTGGVGDLWIESDAVCSHYWNRPDATKESIHGNWLKTGDRYSQDNDGFFWFKGRSDDMIKSGGQWVSPVEVEGLLMEHPAIQEAAVVAHSESDLTRIKAFVVLRSDESPDNILDFASSKLPRYKRPAWIEVVNELPKTATGKIQRFKLREL